MAGPLPLSFEAIDRYALRFGFQDFRFFLRCIECGEAAFFEHVKEKHDQEEKKKPVKPKKRR